MSALAYRNMSKSFELSSHGKQAIIKMYFDHFPAGTVVRGEILLNNRPIGPFMHRISGFVHQDDLFDGNLTVLEHLTFIVSLFTHKLVLKSDKPKHLNSFLGKSEAGQKN